MSADPKSFSRPRFLSAHDLATRWRVHVVTVWQWAREGRIPKPVRLFGSRATRWRDDDIEAAEQASPTPPNTPPQTRTRRKVAAE
jgi:predicted DNA-binding transcriptional regulator AlpA